MKSRREGSILYKNETRVGFFWSLVVFLNLILLLAGGGGSMAEEEIKLYVDLSGKAFPIYEG